MKLISTAEAAKVYGVKPKTICLWVRTNQVAGTQDKPMLIDAADLERHILSRANPRMRELYSGQPGSGCGISVKEAA